MFILGKFHSGIEPLFYLTFPHKTATFTFFDQFRRRLCLICIPAHWFLVLPFTLCRFLSRRYDDLRDLDLKWTHITTFGPPIQSTKDTLFWWLNPKPSKWQSELTFWRLKDFPRKMALFRSRKGLFCEGFLSFSTCNTFSWVSTLGWSTFLKKALFLGILTYFREVTRHLKMRAFFLK